MICITLDISSKIIGCAVFVDAQLKMLLYLRMPKKTTLFEKFSFIDRMVDSIPQSFKADQIIIEAPKEQFKRGKTRANTMMILYAFNMYVSYKLLPYTKKLIHLSETTARKPYGLNKKLLDENGEKDKRSNARKKFIFEELSPLLPEWPVVHMKTRHGNPKDFVADLLDAYVLGRYWRKYGSD